MGFRVIKVVPEQASISRGDVGRAVNEIHFAIARSLFMATAGRVSIAGKELYVAAETHNDNSSAVRDGPRSALKPTIIVG